MADISIISDHALYDWVKFYDPVGKHFPEEKMYLERYRGPAIDVGTDLTENIFKSNGEVVHCSTYLFLLPEEVSDEKEVRREFDAMIEYNLAPKAVEDDFGEIGLKETPTFDKYEDGGVEGTPDELMEEL